MQLTLDFPLTFDPSWDYYSKGWSSYERAIRDKYGIENGWWSMEAVDMEAEGYTDLEMIWMDAPVSGRYTVALGGTRAIDVWMAFEKLIIKSGDYHHSFLEGLSKDGRVLTGS